MCIAGKLNWRKCLLLTGTPLQNNTEELWTLLNFIDPSAFASKATFTEQFGDMASSEKVSASCFAAVCILVNAIYTLASCVHTLAS